MAVAVGGKAPAATSKARAARRRSVAGLPAKVALAALRAKAGREARAIMEDERDTAA
jgi:hypothetical protein